MESEKKETKKRTRKKKVEKTDIEITKAAFLALSGIYGSGRFMEHRLVMNYGKKKAALILKEIDNISKTIVK